MSLDPSKPINDPTVWYPQGMYLEDYDSSLAAKTAAADDGEKTFLLSEANMVALNRFLWTGRLLSTTRNDYSSLLGIIDTSVMSEEVWGAVDDLLVTYTDVKSNCTGFMDDSWPKISATADDIYYYASLAGGKENSSYYAVMLGWLKEYSEEKKKPSPDQDKLTELRSNIQDVSQDMMDKITKLQAGATSAYNDLTTFHSSCKGYSTTLTGNQNTMESLLQKEGNDIVELQAKINEATEKLKDYQAQIDADHIKLRDTAWYVWLGAWGMIAAVIVATNANADIRRLEEAMKELRDVLAQDTIKLKTAVSLQTNTTSMKMQISGFVEQIGPALTTLELLQAAWHNMSSDLQFIYDLVSDDFQDEVPSVGLGTLELNKIIEEWNTLKTYVGNYRDTVYLTENPQVISPDDYLKQLDAAIKTLAAYSQA